MKQRLLITLGTCAIGSWSGAPSSNSSKHTPAYADISAGSADTVVAYGDASFSSSCCKGNPSTPAVSLRRNLGYHCKVFDTDEVCTSRLCCARKTAMEGMLLPVTGNPYRISELTCRPHIDLCCTCCNTVTSLHTQYFDKSPNTVFWVHSSPPNSYPTPSIASAIQSTAKSHTNVSRQTDTAPIYVTAAHQQADSAQYACRKGLKGSQTRELQCVAVSKTECRTIWNLDVSATNILHLSLDWAESRAKPPEFCRDAR